MKLTGKNPSQQSRNNLNETNRLYGRQLCPAEWFSLEIKKATHLLGCLLFYIIEYFYSKKSSDLSQEC